MLVKAFVIVPLVCAVVDSPETFPLLAATHENVEGTFVASEVFSPIPLQTVKLLELVSIGEGLTVTLTVCATPGQLPVEAVGVTV